MTRECFKSKNSIRHEVVTIHWLKFGKSSSQRAPRVVTDTKRIVIESELSGHSDELRAYMIRHLLPAAFPGKDDSSVVLENRQSSAPEHQQVIPLVGPRHDPPELLLQQNKSLRQMLTRCTKSRSYLLSSGIMNRLALIRILEKVIKTTVSYIFCHLRGPH